MRNMLDFSPYRRSMIGFDHLFDILESASRFDVAGYPPYDVNQEGDDTYRVRLAVAGYTTTDIDITAHENVLVVTGRQQQPEQERNYLHRGIPGGEFERRFQLADHVKVVGASLADGILEIELKREVPEAAKPKKIAIGQAAPAKRIAKPQAEAA